MKKIVVGALVLAILHSILFYGQGFGVSVVLFTIPTLLLIIYSLYSKNKVKNAKAFLLSIPITLLSLTYAIFNNAFLNVVNFFTIIALTTVMRVWAEYNDFNFSNMFCKFFVILFAPLGHIVEAVKLINSTLFKKNRIKTEEAKVVKENKVVKQIIVGLIISIPLLIIILALLISADTIFAQILGPIKYVLKNIFSFKFLASLYFRAGIGILVFIYIVAFICTILKFNTDIQKVQSKGVNLQNITVNTVLTVLNVVYALFCIVQFAFLFTKFGVNAEFDYATYARRGFFQLMIVTLINFAIIIVTNLNKRKTSTGVLVYTKIMNTLLIVFTFIMLISSALRMYLYEQEYGYTFFRLLVYFILFSELIATIPTLIYVYTKK